MCWKGTKVSVKQILFSSSSLPSQRVRFENFVNFAHTYCKMEQVKEDKKRLFSESSL